MFLSRLLQLQNSELLSILAFTNDCGDQLFLLNLWVFGLREVVWWRLVSVLLVFEVFCVRVQWVVLILLNEPREVRLTFANTLHKLRIWLRNRLLPFHWLQCYVLRLGLKLDGFYCRLLLLNVRRFELHRLRRVLEWDKWFDWFPRSHHLSDLLVEIEQVILLLLELCVSLTFIPNLEFGLLLRLLFLL